MSGPGRSQSKLPVRLERRLPRESRSKYRDVSGTKCQLRDSRLRRWRNFRFRSASPRFSISIRRAATSFPATVAWSIPFAAFLQTEGGGDLDRGGLRGRPGGPLGGRNAVRKRAGAGWRLLVLGRDLGGISAAHRHGNGRSGAGVARAAVYARATNYDFGACPRRAKWDSRRRIHLDRDGVTFSNGETMSSGGLFGRYDLVLPPGEVSLTFDAPGYFPGHILVHLHVDQRGLDSDVALEPRGPVAAGDGGDAGDGAVLFDASTPGGSTMDGVSEDAADGSEDAGLDARRREDVVRQPSGGGCQCGVAGDRSNWRGMIPVMAIVLTCVRRRRRIGGSR